VGEDAAAQQRAGIFSPSGGRSGGGGGGGGGGSGGGGGASSDSGIDLSTLALAAAMTTTKEVVSRVLQAMSRHPLLLSTSRETLLRLYRHMQLRHYGRGTLVVAQRSASDRLYIVESGARDRPEIGPRSARDCPEAPRCRVEREIAEPADVELALPANVEPADLGRSPRGDARRAERDTIAGA